MLIHEGFQQVVPDLGSGSWSDDAALRAVVQRLVPLEVFQRIDTDLRLFERVVAGPVRNLRMKASEPHLVQYNQWGRRVDELHTSEGWRGIKRIAAEEGMVATAFERREGEYSRLWGLVKTHIWTPESASVGCPVAMTDGAFRVLELHATKNMKADIMPRLVSRDADSAWLAAQWMTERPGGSDVSQTETVAVPVDERAKPKNGDAFLIDGFKWFSSATDADVTLALARTGTVEAGARGLSLFAIKMRRDDGQLNGVQIHRLKNKWGTKSLPTAELSLKGAVGHLVGNLNEGVKTIASVLNITRIHSAVSCTSSLGRALHLARAFARVRHVGGAQGGLLSANPLHTSMLSSSQIVYCALVQLTFSLSLLMGREERGTASPAERTRLRLLTPVVKTFCARLATREILNLMESWGGQGYMEENEFGRLIQDASVERIWEGTSNVLALDVARVILQTKGKAIEEVVHWANGVLNACGAVFESEAIPTMQADCKLLQQASQRLVSGDKHSSPSLPRALLFHLGYLCSSVLLLEQAIWSAQQQQERVEHSVDQYVLKRWVAGESREAARDLAEALKSDAAQTEATMQHTLVYGSKL